MSPASGAGEGRARGLRDNGPWRSANRPTALQPKKRLTRSRITSEACWISSAIGPSTRSTKVAGVDSSREMVEQARARKPEYPLGFLAANRSAYLQLSRLIEGVTVVPPASVEEVGRFLAYRVIAFEAAALRELDPHPAAV